MSLVDGGCLNKWKMWRDNDRIDEDVHLCSNRETQILILHLKCVSAAAAASAVYEVWEPATL